MAKSMAPKKAPPIKAKAKTPAKAAPKKAAPMKAAAKDLKPAKKVAAPAKPAPKAKIAAKAPATASAKGAPISANAKNLKAKAPLKSDLKKDVKSLAPAKPIAAAKSGKLEVTAPLAKNAKAPKAATAAPVPIVQKPLTKPAKVAKGKGVKAARAPKNYENMCREIACESSSTTSGYCRLHYIKNWKKIKRKELILKEKKLNQYIEELVSKYPDKYIEAIKGDLSDEQAFSKVIYDLELDESVDEIPGDDEADESIIDNIKREFDDGDTDF